MKEEKEILFYNFIMDSLSENPEWMNTAINAILAGTKQYINNLKARYVELDTALLAALGLLDKKRMSKELTEHLTTLISNKIKKSKNICKLEEDFIKENP